MEQTKSDSLKKLFKVKCPNCNYEWETKSDKLWTSCPNCQRKFEKEKNIQKGDKQKVSD